MQNSGSRMTFVAILAFDLFESVMVYHDIQSQTEQLRGLILPQCMMELCMELLIYPVEYDAKYGRVFHQKQNCLKSKLKMISRSDH